MRNLRVSATFSKYLCGGILLFISTFLIIILLLSVSSAFLKKSLTDSYTVSSKVEIVKSSDKDVTYSPVYHYYVNGAEYICASGAGSSIKPSDENKKIYYNTKNPNICISEYEITFAYIFALIFIIVIISIVAFSLYIIIGTFLKNSKIKQLTKTGKLIKDIPCKIFPKGPFMNGYPLIFEANYVWRRGMGQLYGTQGYVVEVEYNGLKLKSEVKYKIDIRKDTADLLIDPLNPKNYFIDFDII